MKTAFQFFSAVAIVWFCIFAMGLVGCIQEQGKAYRSITSKPQPVKTIRMPASNFTKVGV